MKTSKIKIIPTSYPSVVKLLNSESLRAVEDPIAIVVGRNIIKDQSTASLTYILADISVSGMSAEDMDVFLLGNREMLIKFGTHFYKDELAGENDEEFPEGEEIGTDDASQTVKILGLGMGFGIKLAIYYNFLANRGLDEFFEYLKNRRIPHYRKFAQKLERIFEKCAEL